jgi:hypothetical protein
MEQKLVITNLLLAVIAALLFYFMFKLGVFRA